MIKEQNKWLASSEASLEKDYISHQDEAAMTHWGGQILS
jgi:hypothetical protein